MEQIAQHVSPDGILRLNVRRDADEFMIIGFNDFAWSTSSGFLASKWGLSEDAAVGRFVHEVLGNRAIIAVAHAGSAIRDVWVTDRPDSELKYKRHEETIVFRFWDGSRWGIEIAGVDDETPHD
ncbi:MAG: hypothetical protein AB9869_15740 [Verrucomicrobiia bacterium]